MAGVGRKIAEEMTGFARGVYKNIDSKATTKMAYNHVKNTGVDFNTAKKIIDKSTDSTAGKLGKQVSNLAPFKGMRDSARDYTKTKNSGKEASVLGSIKQGHYKRDSKGNAIINKTTNKAEYDMGKIAGTTASLGVAGRIATGGGLYKDKYGNTNLPGVPFI